MNLITSPSIRHKPVKPKEDRPGWVPAWVGEAWDQDPYAYQTEEELMPAGGLHGQILAYLGQGIPLYVVIDAITRRGKPRKQTAVMGWELMNGRPHSIPLDDDGKLNLPSLGLTLYADGRQLRFIDRHSGERLLDAEELTAALTAAQTARQAAEAELARLREKLAQYEE